MRPFDSKIAFVACALVCAAFSSPTRGAEPTSAEAKLAKDMIRDAIKEEKAGKCEDAIAMLKQAQAIRESSELFLHMGECQTKQGALVEGLRSWEHGQELARTEKDKGNEKLLAAKILALHDRLPTLILRIPADAKHVVIKIDDKDIPGERLGAPIELDPGDHAIVATADERKPWSSKVSLAEKESKVVAISIPMANLPVDATPETTSEPVTGPPPDTTATPDTQPNKIPTVTWVAGGAAIAFTAVGFIMFGAAGGAASSGRDACAVATSCDPSAASKVHTLDTLALTFWIGAGIGAGVAVTTFVVSRKKKTEPPPPSASLVVGPGSFGVRGAF